MQGPDTSMYVGQEAIDLWLEGQVPVELDKQYTQNAGGWAGWSGVQGGRGVDGVHFVQGGWGGQGGQILACRNAAPESQRLDIRIKLTS